MAISTFASILRLGLWFALWGLGGWLIAVHAFRLPARENAIAGFAMGLAVATWSSNLIAQVLPVPLAFWLGGAGTLILGLLCWQPWRAAGPGTRIQLVPGPWLLLGGLTLLFTLIGRGLALFDEFQNVPLVSMLAAGDIPPHFPLDPSIRFGYHYYQLLIAAELMRVGGLYPWLALDAARALTIALSVVLCGLLARRLTGDRRAALLAGGFLLFAGGSRWLLLLLPVPWLDRISDGMYLLASTTRTGSTLREALLGPWLVEGGPPLQFPFAFANGINTPLSMSFSGAGAAGGMLSLLLLITARKWKNAWSAVFWVLILTCLALADEIGFVLLAAGFVFVAAANWVQTRSLRLPSTLLRWAAVAGLAFLIALVQGGVFTEALHHGPGPAGVGEATFFSLTFQPAWPPNVVSAHLGVLKLTDPSQFLVALAEIGPILLLVPLLVKWFLRLVRHRVWGESLVIGSGLASLATVLVNYTGTGGLRNTSRFYGELLFMCKIYAVPLLWVWLRGRPPRLRAFWAAAATVAVAGGLVFFASELSAINQPVLTTFATNLDVKMLDDFWDQLEPGTLIFDPIAFRAPALFARPTKAAFNWYQADPVWIARVKSPDVYDLRAAGFDYVYVDKHYMLSLGRHDSDWLEAPCVRLVREYARVVAEKDYGDYRRLFDIRGCVH